MEDPIPQRTIQSLRPRPPFRRVMAARQMRSSNVSIESFEDNVSKLTNYCYDEKNFKVPIMEAVERVLGK